MWLHVSVHARCVWMESCVVRQSYRLRAGQLLEAKPQFHFPNHTSRKILKLQQSLKKWGNIEMRHQRQNQKENGGSETLWKCLQFIPIYLNTPLITNCFKWYKCSCLWSSVKHDGWFLVQ